MYIPIHVHTMWSLLDSSIIIDKLAERAAEYKLPAVCMTDHGNIKGLVTFYNQMKKKGVQPIIGCETNIYDEQTRKVSRLTVLAKNKVGYDNLIKLISKSNEKSNIVGGKPTLSLEELYDYKFGLIGLMGDIQCEISQSIFTDWQQAYKSQDDCEPLLKEGYLAIAIKIANLYEEFFDDFFLFTDLDCKLPVLKVLNDCILSISSLTKIPCLPSNNIHYLDEQDKKIHNIVIQSAIESIKKPTEKLEDFHDYRIFLSDHSQCHLLPELPDGDKTLVLLDIVEDYEIKQQPILPKFRVGDNVVRDPDKLLYDLCKRGFVSRGLKDELKTKPTLKKVYGQRVQEELKTFSEIGLSAYFLIVKDVIDYCRDNDIYADVRGSSTGCLINYLLGVSSVDPLRPDPTLAYDPGRELPLSRFYNKGRNTGVHVSLPDVDIDCPPHFRNDIIEYLKDKYGHDCVAHIITHSRFKGKGAIKEVFRLSGLRNYYEISDQITKKMTDEAKISDELAEIQEENPDYGIIQWNIDHIKDIGDFYDEYQEIFDLAIALEKIPKHQSVHAAGLIVADRPLGTIFPMCYWEKTDEQVVGIEGAEVEELGGLKLDLLGVHMLEKCYLVQYMVNNKLDELPNSFKESLVSSWA